MASKQLCGHSRAGWRLPESSEGAPGCFSILTSPVLSSFQHGGRPRGADQAATRGRAAVPAPPWEPRGPAFQEGSWAAGCQDSGVHGRMNGGTGLCCGWRSGSQKDCRGFRASCRPGRCWRCLQAGALRQSGCWGPPATRGPTGQTALSPFRVGPSSQVRSEPVPGAALRPLPRPGRRAGVRPPALRPPGLAVVLGQLCSVPPSWFCFCWSRFLSHLLCWAVSSLRTGGVTL